MTRFGIEYTFLKYPGDKRSLYQISQRLEDKGFTRAHVDPGVVEVPSPPHRSLEEAKHFFDRLGKAVGLEALVPRIVSLDEDGSEIYYGTGGGHVHVELPYDRSLKTKTLDQLLHSVCKRPWLNWVFNEFMDDQNANSLLGNRQIRNYIKTGEFSSDYWGYNGSDKYLNLMNNLYSNEHGIRVNNDGKTIEFRIFDMPRSWQQVQDHVEFSLAFVSWSLKRAKSNTKPEKVNSIPLDERGYLNFRKKYSKIKDVKIPFKRLIKILGLDWKRYSKYIRNYSDRLKYGELT